MKDIQYTAPNDFRAFCEMLNETGTSMAHHGIKGQQWGVRRFQNQDGTYTEAGKKRYFKNAGDRIKSLKEKITGKPVEQTKTPEEIRNESRLAAAQAKLDAQPLKYNTKYTVRDPVIKKTISAFDELTKAANKIGGEYKNTKLKTSHDIPNDKMKLLALAGVGAGLGALSGVPMKFEHLEAQAPITRFWTTNFNGHATPHWSSYVPEPKTVRERSGVYIGAAAVAGAALSIGGYLGLSKIRAHKAEIANKQLQDVENEIRNNKNKDSKTGLKIINGDHSWEDDLSKINPAFNNLSKTTKNNCINCVVSMALRRKGYDVNAGGETILGKHSALFTEMFPKCKLEYTKNDGDGSSFITKITKMSPESWGYCGTQFKDGGGHAMMYMVKNGKFILMDPQSGKIYSDSQTKKILSKSSGIDYARLDDVSPDIKKCISRGTIDMAPYAEQTVKNAQRHGMQSIQNINRQQIEELQRISQQQMEETQRINQQQVEETQRINQQQVQQQIQQQMMFNQPFMMFGKKKSERSGNMRHDIYTAPNDFRAFCEMLNETETSMAHHGIPGMKWGIRRYQNYDGTLTQKGVRRYRTAEKIYNDTKSTYKKLKDTPDASKEDIIKAKKQYRKSKNDLKKTYNELKKDKAADKGKSLYNKGKTITGNAEVVRNTAIASSVGLVAAHFLQDNGHPKEAKYVAAAAAGATAIGSILSIKNRSQAKKLRAYYTHTSTVLSKSLDAKAKKMKDKAIDAVVKAERKAPKTKTPWNEKPTPNTTWNEKPRKKQHNI